MIDAIIRWLFPPRETSAIEPASALRLHLSETTLEQLRLLVTPHAGRYEPLAVAWVRYASEHNGTVIVVVKALPLPERAYVPGPDGANFDVRALMVEADRAGAQNAGLLLCHMHAHDGVPAFGTVDSRTNRTIMCKLYVACPDLPYGALLLSNNSATARIATTKGLERADIVVVPSLYRRKRMLDVSA